jgi:predicted nucleic acid-binding protein
VTGFLDTNVLIYAVSNDEEKRARARSLLAGREDLLVSVQVMNEFVFVARRKLRLPWDEILDARASFHAAGVALMPYTVSAHESAVAIATKHDIVIYDASIIACALEAGCDTLWTEDLTDGQRFGGLTVRNPFKAD